MNNVYACFLLILLLTANNVCAMTVKKTHQSPKIDGEIEPNIWKKATWHAIDQLIVGNEPTPEDFSGRFKLLWDKNYLYLLAEIQDDVLFDQHADPLLSYWDDDCLEVFIDQDASGGNHQFSYNAFAYHIALDNQVVDIGENKPNGDVNFVLLNDHITSKWRRSENAPHKIIWELAIRIYDDSFKLGGNNIPVTLNANNQMGFMLAYCDNDGSKTREHFVGSTPIKAVNGDKNLGYITADVFDVITLVD